MPPFATDCHFQPAECASCQARPRIPRAHNRAYFAITLVAAMLASRAPRAPSIHPPRMRYIERNLSGGLNTTEAIPARFPFSKRSSAHHLLYRPSFSNHESSAAYGSCAREDCNSPIDPFTSTCSCTLFELYRKLDLKRRIGRSLSHPPCRTSAPRK